MNIDSIEKGDLVHLARGAKRFCTVIEVCKKEPKYKVQFGNDPCSVEIFRSYELALVQKCTPREDDRSSR